jgi:hypothetical protein
MYFLRLFAPLCPTHLAHHPIATHLTKVISRIPCKPQSAKSLLEDEMAMERAAVFQQGFLITL